jgi:thymidylate synthase
VQAVEEVKWVLGGCLPYLKLKRTKAEVALTNCDYPSRRAFGEEGEPRFSHSYPERYWPPRGHGIRYPFGNLNNLLSLLAREPYTRQAVLPMFTHEDVYAADVAQERVPCSLSWHFMLRGGRLHCQYPMRSVDLYRYLPDDLYMAGRLVQWVIERLQGREQDLLHRINKDIPEEYRSSTEDIAPAQRPGQADIRLAHGCSTDRLRQPTSEGRRC